MPIDRRAGVGHQLTGIEVGRMAAMEDRQGDVGREETEPGSVRPNELEAVNLIP